MTQIISLSKRWLSKNIVTYLVVVLIAAVVVVTVVGGNRKINKNCQITLMLKLLLIFAFFDSELKFFDDFDYFEVEFRYLWSATIVSTLLQLLSCLFALKEPFTNSVIWFLNTLNNSDRICIQTFEQKISLSGKTNFKLRRIQRAIRATYGYVSNVLLFSKHLTTGFN